MESKQFRQTRGLLTTNKHAQRPFVILPRRGGLEISVNEKNDLNPCVACSVIRPNEPLRLCSSAPGVLSREAESYRQALEPTVEATLRNPIV